MTVLETPRLILRTWRPEDLEPFARMNADPEVRKFFPTIPTREESDGEAQRIQEIQKEQGFCFYAAELKATREFTGFIGISVPRWQPPFAWKQPGPCVEIGWRLARAFWNQGLATEGAAAVLHYGFKDLQLPEIVALTLPTNLPSRRVMEKIGMTRDPGDDFPHPRLPSGHPMSTHVLYRAWKTTARNQPSKS